MLTNFTSQRFIYAAFFRIAIGIVLLIDILFLFPIAKENYAIPNFEYGYNFVFLSYLRQHIYLFLIAFSLTLLSFIAGIGKYYTAFLVYIFYTLNFLLLAPHITWGDFILQHSLLFFIVANSFAYGSVRPFSPKKTVLHKLAILSIIIHVCYIFISNSYHKLQSEDWLNGVAVAHFLQHSSPLDFLHIGDFLAQQEWFCKLATYGTLVFQTLFPLAILFKKSRNFWLLIGIVLHIVFAFMLHLYKFQIILLLHFGFFFTDKELLKTKFFQFFRTFAFAKNKLSG